MAAYSSINLSQIEYTRIDADFYHPLYLKELQNWKKLRESVGIAKLYQLIIKPVRTGRTPSSRTIKSEEETVPFVKTDTLREGYIDFSKTPALPTRVLSSSDIISPNSVVVTIIGATPAIVGRAAIVRDSDPQCVTNQNVAVICTNERCDPYFLTAFFQTKFGRDQLWRHSRRTEQVNLNCREVERVLVPTPDIKVQQEIGDLVRNSFHASDQSDGLYTQAQQLLESELGLDNLTFQKPVGYTANLSEALSSIRVDADYFQPQYAVVRSLVKAYSGGYVPLLAFCDSLKPNIVPSKSPKQAFDYIELSNINSSIGIVEGAMSGRGNELPSRARRQVQFGDVIASAVVGSIDKAAIIADQQNGFIASTGFFHLRPRTIPAEYLLMLIRSQCVRMQFQQQATGGILSAVPDSRLRHVIIPKLPEPIQQEIVGLVIGSHTAKRESDKLLHQAKARVEQLIEEAVAS